MKMWKKALIAAAVVVALFTMIITSVYQANKNRVVVQTGYVVRQDLTTIVSASGEITQTSGTLSVS